MKINREIQKKKKKKKKKQKQKKNGILRKVNPDQ